MSMSVPGNIWDTRNDIIPTRWPGKRKRENAYAAKQARATPMTAVSAATIALFTIQRAKGWSVNTETKFEADQRAGHGRIARNRSRNVGSGGTSAIARFCRPEKAM